VAVLTGAHLLLAPPGAATRAASWLEGAGIPWEICDAADVARLEPADACGLEGWWVQWSPLGTNRDRELYAGLVLVCPPAQLPWLDPSLLDWEAGRPALVAGVLAPGLANIYVLGAGAEGLRAGGARLLVAMIHAQCGLAHPLVDELVRLVRPSHEPVPGRHSRRVERRLARRLAGEGAAAWWASVRDLDGPLLSARAN
jgi:hypothetical protein